MATEKIVFAAGPGEVNGAVVFLLALLYLLPSIVARIRGVKSVVIFATNLFLGWTVIGWLFVMWQELQPDFGRDGTSRVPAPFDIGTVLPHESSRECPHCARIVEIDRLAGHAGGYKQLTCPHCGGGFKYYKAGFPG